MVRAYDQNGIRFATWVGHGRDPEVAYLDDIQMVIGSAELTSDGLHLSDRGTSYNTLGGEVRGPLDRAVLHRISHATLDRDGLQWFRLDGPDSGCGETDKLCAVARQAPSIDTPYHEAGAFHADADCALQWVTWTDAVRSGTLRRAVYVDSRYLLEAGLGRDESVRVWPSRGLSPFGLELAAPTANEAALIEERIARITQRAP